MWIVKSSLLSWRNGQKIYFPQMSLTSKSIGTKGGTWRNPIFYQSSATLRTKTKQNRKELYKAFSALKVKALMWKQVSTHRVVCLNWFSSATFTVSTPNQWKHEYVQTCRLWCSSVVFPINQYLLLLQCISKIWHKVWIRAELNIFRYWEKSTCLLNGFLRCSSVADFLQGRR